MSGVWYSGSGSRAHAGHRPIKARRRLDFEALDERAVLSATSAAFEPELPGDTPAIVQSRDAQTVAPVSDPLAAVPLLQNPQGANKTVMMSGLTYTFNPTDFGFSDPGDSPPNLFSAVKITTLPFPGTLVMNGGVAPGQFISFSNLQSGQLKFTTSGVETVSFASFTFQVQDNTGALDPSPKTFTLFFANQDTNFVRGLYVDVLGRQPDAGGFTTWLNLLSAGASNRQVASAIWQTPEHRGLQVDGFYQQFLKRAPDPAGRQVWINQFLAGMNEETMMAAFMNTPEYQANKASNTSFVIAVYQDVLNRNPDPGGQAFWVGALNNGQLTRNQVATGLINTPERHVKLVTSYYLDFFRRQPDSFGLAFWVDQLNSGLLGDADVAIALLASPEFANLRH